MTTSASSWHSRWSMPEMKRLRHRSGDLECVLLQRLYRAATRRDRRSERHTHTALPQDLDYRALAGLQRSTQKLSEIRPARSAGRTRAGVSRPRSRFCWCISRQATG